MIDDIKVSRFINNPITSNCYVIYKKGEKSCLLIDPGDNNPEKLMLFLEQKNLSPEYIILTHEHFDHVSGANSLRSTYSCKLIATKECSNSLPNPKKNLSVFHDNIGFSVAHADIIVANEHFEWGAQSLRFLKTPGHSPGGLCFHLGNNLFTGDTILQNYKTVTKIVGGNKQHLLASLNEIFSTFDGDTMIFPGHGVRFLLKDVSINALI